MHEIPTFRVNTLSIQDEINLLLNTAKQLRYHYFGVEQQQTLLSLLDSSSQVSGTNLLSYLIEICGAQVTKGSIHPICDPLTNIYISLIYDTFLNPLSDILFEFLNGVWTEIKPSDRTGAIKNS